ncbi:MAG: SMI1/KNR4 family protein [Loktanella sp.]|nr:SMI1/KNR4 family protein [Loktanella sp.]
MRADIESITESDCQNELAPLVPLGEQHVTEIAVRHPNISVQYLHFLQHIGVGTTTTGMHVYEPQPINEIINHPSFKIYNSKPSRRLFGLVAEKSVFPTDALIIADSGASWRYCVRLSKPDTVYIADMLGPTFDTEATDFFTFVRNTVILGTEP